MLPLGIGVAGTTAALCLIALAAVRFGRRDYARARKLARHAILITCGSSALVMVTSILVFISRRDPSESRATALARGISSWMNESLPLVILGWVALVFWIACVYCMRRESKRSVL